MKGTNMSNRDYHEEQFINYVDKLFENDENISCVMGVTNENFNILATEVDFEVEGEPPRTLTIFDGSFAEVEDAFYASRTQKPAENVVHIPVMLDEGCDIPGYAHDDDAGVDLRANETVTIKPFERKMVGTGMRTAIPRGYVGLCFPRSGLATKLGISLANCVAVIDSGYRGEWKAALINMNPEKEITIEKGERVFQLIVMPFPRVVFDAVTQLDETERGEGGFGSSGRN